MPVMCAREINETFSLVLTTGKFPDKWKIACVIPLHKGGNKTAVHNYRPISLLPLVGKLMEKIMHRRIYKFLDTNNFFAKEECGFRPKIGTEDAIANLLNYFYRNINNKNSDSGILVIIC